MPTEPLIVDPDDYDKQRAWNEGIALCNAFLDANDVPHPVYRSTLSPAGRRWERRYKKLHGYYRAEQALVAVDVAGSRCPVKTPGYAWSFTGHKSDLTAPGILAHEVGHHVDYCLGVTEEHRLRNRFRGEPSITGYDHGNTSSEMFAEMMKLFILNPDLLRQGRPRRYLFLTQTCGLRPAFDPDEYSWEDVLLFAHDKIISAAKAWIRHGTAH